MALSALPIALLAALVSAQSADAVACSADFPATLADGTAEKPTITVQKTVFTTKDFKYCENEIEITDTSKWRLTCTAKLYPGSYIQVEPAKANPMAYFCNGESDNDGLDADGSCGADRCFSTLLATKDKYKLKIGSEYFKLKDNVVCSLKKEMTYTKYAATPAATDEEKVVEASIKGNVPDLVLAASKAITEPVDAAKIKAELAKLKEVKRIVTVGTKNKKVEVRFREFEVVQGGSKLLVENTAEATTKIIEFRKVFRKDDTDSAHLGLVGAKYKIDPATKIKAKFTAAGKVAGIIEYKMTGVESYLAAVVKLGFDSSDKKFTHSLKNLELMLGDLPAADTPTCETTNEAVCNLIAAEIKKAAFSKALIEEVFETTKANTIYYLEEKVKASDATKIAPKDYFGFLFNNLINAKVVDLNTFAAYQAGIKKKIENYATNYNAMLALEGTPEDNFKDGTKIVMENVALDSASPKYRFDLKITDLEVSTTLSGNKNTDMLKTEVVYEVKLTLAADYKSVQTVDSKTPSTVTVNAINALTETATAKMECATAHQGDSGNTDADYCKKWKNFLVADPKKILENLAVDVGTKAVVELFYDYVMKPILAA